MVFFLILSFCIKLFAFELCYFFTFLSVSLFRGRVGQANTSQLVFSFSNFFYLISIFIVRSLFWKYNFFFISISSREWQVSQVSPGWLKFVFYLDILWYFFQFYYFALIYLSLSFDIFFIFFMFGYSESRLVKLTRGFWNFFFWTLVLFTSFFFYYSDLVELSWLIIELYK